MVANPRITLESIRRLLPPPPRPLGSYQSVTRDGRLVFVSGFGPFSNGKPVTGIVGEDMSLTEAKAAAELSMLMILSCLDDVVRLENVRCCLRMTVYIRTTRSFLDQPAVADGASDLLRDLFGQENAPARTSMGVYTLPFGFPLEIDSIFQLEDGH